MKRITKDDTSLTAFGLTPELILDGERAEFDPEKKVTPRQKSYIQHDFAKKLTDAYADDLVAAYRAIEELEEEIERLKQELSETGSMAAENAEQVRKVLKGQEGFQEAERLLATFEKQLETLSNDKQRDADTIKKLSMQVEELIELKDTVPQLENDVNQVLANLRQYMAEEGIDTSMETAATNAGGFHV